MPMTIRCTDDNKPISTVAHGKPRYCRRRLLSAADVNTVFESDHFQAPLLSSAARAAAARMLAQK